MPLMFLNGTAMSGQKDHGSHRGSTFVREAHTSPKYRFFAIRDEFPGLLPVSLAGCSIAGELYQIPDKILRTRLLPSEPVELSFGEVELDGGEIVNAMLLTPERIKAGDKIVDIADFGGFRSYQAFLLANARLCEVLGRHDLNTL